MKRESQTFWWLAAIALVALTAAAVLVVVPSSKRDELAFLDRFEPRRMRLLDRYTSCLVIGKAGAAQAADLLAHELPRRGWSLREESSGTDRVQYRRGRDAIEIHRGTGVLMGRDSETGEARRAEYREGEILILVIDRPTWLERRLSRFRRWLFSR